MEVDKIYISFQGGEGNERRSEATRDTYQRGKMALRSRAILPKNILPKLYEIYSMYGFEYFSVTQQPML